MKCRLCCGTTDLIMGDGSVVCYPCVWMLGRVVRDPDSASDKMLTWLDELHSDVVTLVREDDVLAWSWLEPANRERPTWHSVVRGR